MAIPTKSGFYIPSLDGIRALAFSIVFLAHAGLGGVIPGGFGVTIFFFLSGFLITTLLRKEFGQTGTIHLGQFYVRRILRIFPPFYITLTILVIATLVGLLPGEVVMAPIAAQAAFLANYYVLFAISGTRSLAGSEVFWSLAVEEHFYLIFPFLAIPLLRRMTGRAQAAILSVACLGFLAWRCLLVFSFQVSEYRTYASSDTRMDSILFGCILALWCNPVVDPPLRLSSRSKLAIYGASLGLIFFCLVYREALFRETFRYSLQGVALLPLFYFAVAEPDRPWFRWLNWRWIRFFGILSYSLYLIHFSALQMVLYLLPDLSLPLQATVALVLSFFYSSCLYHAVERPLARLRKRLHSDPRPPSAEPTSDASPDDSEGLIVAPRDAE